MKKYLKLGKHTLKTSTSFSSPWWTSQSLAKASSFPIIKLICLSKTRVSNARRSPRGMLMPRPLGPDKTANAPPKGLATWANAPRLPGEAMGTAGIDWCIIRNELFFAFNVTNRETPYGVAIEQGYEHSLLYRIRATQHITYCINNNKNFNHCSEYHRSSLAKDEHRPSVFWCERWPVWQLWG